MKLISTIFGLLVGLVFAGAGSFIALETAVPTLQSWQTMQQWQSTTATILSVHGADNDTLASYHYRVNGKDYQNNRVYVAPFKDNIGSYHKNKFIELNHLKNNLQLVTIWYEPNNPANSVIDRSMRWGLFISISVFCSAFILIGLVVAYALLTSNMSDKEKKLSLTQLRKEWDEKCKDPKYEESFLEFSQQANSEVDIDRSNQANAWLEKKEWRDNRIHSNAKSGMWGMWFFAVFWNAISSPILFALEDELKKENYLVLIGLLFPLVGIFLIKKAWGMTREWKRFGVIELQMDPFPGSIGGHVGGYLHLNNINAFDAKYKVELQCVYTYMSGSGDSRSRKESIKWFESGLARIVTTIDGLDLRFRFDVPDNLPEADIEQSGDYYFWRLKVVAELQGVDLEREYNIPVFQTSVESTHVRHNISAQVEEQLKKQAKEIQFAMAQGDLASTALAGSLRFQDQGNELSFYFPMFRNKVLTMFALIFAGGFSFATYSMIQFFGGDGLLGVGIIIFSIPFALIGLASSLAAFYLLFNNLSVSLAERKLKAVRRLFIIPVKRSVVSIDEIQLLKVESTGSTGQGASKIKHFKIVAYTTDNHRFTIAEDIDGEELATQFKDFIYKRLNMTY